MGRAIAVFSNCDGCVRANFGFMIECIDTTTLFYFKWVGPCCGDPARPEFFSYTSNCLPKEKLPWKNIFSSHFEFVKQSIEPSTAASGTSFAYLNQVCGPTCGGRPIPFEAVNRVDNCFSCLKEGPDQLLPFRFPTSELPISWREARPRPQSDCGATDRTLVQTTSQKKRKRDKGNEEYARQSISTLDHRPATVLFVKQGHSLRSGPVVDVLEPLKAKKFTVFHVSANEEGRYTMLSKKNLVLLAKACEREGGLSLEDHDHMLSALRESSCEWWDTTLVLDIREFLDDRQGFRVVLVPEDDFHKLMPLFPDGVMLKEGTHFLVKGFKGGNETLPFGVMVSRWERWPYKSPNEEFAKLIDETYGKSGFGDRIISNCVGVNLYLGTRASQSARTDGGSGPGEGLNQRFRRDGNNVAQIPRCERVTNEITTLATNMAVLMDPTVYKLLRMLIQEHNVTGICKFKILTQGIPKTWYSFANTRHRDEGDLFREPVLLKEWQEKVDSGLLHPEEKTKLCAQYLKRWIDQFQGFCSPTTCGYVFLGKPEEVEVRQYFFLDGMDVAVRFGHDTVHHMYAGLFAHHTPVCCVIRDNKVTYRDSSGFRVMAWGAGGKNSRR